MQFIHGPIVARHCVHLRAPYCPPYAPYCIALQSAIRWPDTGNPPKHIRTLTNYVFKTKKSISMRACPRLKIRTGWWWRQCWTIRANLGTQGTWNSHRERRMRSLQPLTLHSYVVISIGISKPDRVLTLGQYGPHIQHSVWCYGAMVLWCHDATISNIIFISVSSGDQDAILFVQLWP